MVVDEDMETLKPKNMNLVPTFADNMEKVELTSLQRAEYWPIVED